MILEEIVHGMFDALYARFTNRVKGVVEKEISHNDTVYQTLQSFFQKYPCDRLLVVQYHNGTNYYNGRSIQKTSCTYEITAPGVSTVIRDIQNVLSSEDPEFHLNLYKNKIIKLVKVDECPNNVKKLRLVERGVKSYYAIAVNDLVGNLLGYICVEYVRDLHMMSEDHEEALMNLSNKLSGYLSVGSNSRSEHSILSERLMKLGIILTSVLAIGEMIDIFLRAKPVIMWILRW